MAIAGPLRARFLHSENHMTGKHLRVIVLAGLLTTLPLAAGASGADGQPPADRAGARIAELIENLASADFATREKAATELTKIGVTALPALRKALEQKPGIEASRRLERIVETLELRQAPTFRRHAEWVVADQFSWSLSISPKGKWICASGKRLYDVEGKRELRLEKSAQDLPAFDSRDRRWAYCETARDGSVAIHVWDTETAKEAVTRIPIAAAPKQAPAVLALSASGRYAVIQSPTREHEAWLYDLVDGKTTATFRELKTPYDGGFEDKHRMRFTPDDKRVLFHASNRDHTWHELEIWDIERAATNARLKAWVSQETDRLAISRDGKFIVNGDNDYDIVRFEPATGRKETLFNCRQELYSHYLELRLSANDQVMAVWSSERDQIIFYDLKSKERFTLPRKGRLLAFSQDGRYAFLSHEKGVDTIDVKYRKIARSFAEPAAVAHMSSDGAWLVTGRLVDEGSNTWKVTIFKAAGE
jgi:WD40 repeat protein